MEIEELVETELIECVSEGQCEGIEGESGVGS